MSSQENKIQVVFLVGAARSGTKLLRTILSQSTEIGSIPYDMNYIWKYGHYDLTHDEMNKIIPSQKEIEFIRNYVFKQAKKQNKSFIIEKTVSNTLRVEYLKKIFPDAKIIHLYRDGRDVALSAKQRWEGSLFDKEQQSKKEIIQKIIDLPFLTVAPYLFEYIKNNIRHLVSKTSQHVDTWGPIYKGMQEDKNKFDLLTLCGMQWNKSVESTMNSLKHYTKDIDFIEIQYETLIEETSLEIDKLQEFLHITDIDKLQNYAINNIKKTSKHKWKKESKETIASLEKVIESNLKKLNYTID
jgi:hypothetical protein